MPGDLTEKSSIYSKHFVEGSSKAKLSSVKPQVPKITTFSDEDDAVHFTRTNTRFPSFGAVVESFEGEVESLPQAPHTLGADQWNPFTFKAASAPEPTDAFPTHLKADYEGNGGDEAYVASPAQMFLSAFSPPAVSKADIPDAEGIEVGSYTLGPLIGYGGFSTIRKAYSSCGAVVAIKIIKRADIDRQDNPEETRKHLDNECAIWTSLKHEHIMPLFSTVRTLHADYFVTLYCPAGSLFDILKRDGVPALPQDDAGTMFRQIVRGLRYLHEVARLVHGDIKLENVFVDEMGSCRIGDFGLSKRIPEFVADGECECHQGAHETADDTASFGTFHERVRRRNTTFASSTNSSRSSLHLSLRRSRGPSRHRNSTPFPTEVSGDHSAAHSSHPFHQFPAGSLPYAAPEMLLPPPTPPNFCPVHPHAFAPNPAQDMWALGVLLYALLTGRLPFADNFEPRLQMKILHGAYDVPSGIGHGAESVLRGCIEQSIQNRWTIDMVDDIAWGVGWGLAGDVSNPPSASPSGEISPGPHYFSDDYRRERSQSRPRPYPAQEFVMHQFNTHNEDVQSSALSSSSSRSRSRSNRPKSHTRGSSERSLSKSSSVLAEDSAVTGYPQTSAASRRGRRVQKSNADAGVRYSPVVGQTPSYSRSRSHSRSRSPSLNEVPPTTPPDVVPTTAYGFPPFGDTAISSVPVDLQQQQTTRRRGRSTRNSKPPSQQAESGTGTPLDVVEERLMEAPAGRWSPSSVLDAQALPLED